MGFFWFYFRHGVVLYVNSAPCRTQTAIANGEFGVTEQAANGTGETCLNRHYRWRFVQARNRQSNWRVPLSARLQGCRR
ncbi:hypothetical protein HKD37_17G047853 [Glycine soja]